jgi:enterochelin esterase-like enzyme
MRAAYLLLFATLLGSASAQQAPQFHLADCAAAKPTDSACRVVRAPDVTEVLNRLGGKDTVWWRHDDQLTVAARRTGENVQICCAFEEPMDRIPGTDLWTLTVRSSHLDGAIVDIMVYASIDWGSRNVRMSGVWRGPTAPPAPPTAMLLSGEIESIEIDSPNLGEKRKVDVYLPAAHAPNNSYPVIYMTDGRDVHHYASMLEPLITAKKVPPIILVGLHSGQGNPVPGNKIDRRNADYLLGTSIGDTFFIKHEAFLLQEVIPQAEHRFGASSNPAERVLMGQSSGASWALETGLRNPKLFARAIGFSLCAVDRDGHRRWGPDKPKLFLTGGLFEDCGTNAAKAAQAAKAAGEDVVFETHASGHSSLMWDVQFVDALSWAYGAR